MLRIFDLLPEHEILNIKKVQTQIKLEKYRTVRTYFELTGWEVSDVRVEAGSFYGQTRN